MKISERFGIDHCPRIRWRHRWMEEVFVNDRDRSIRSARFAQSDQNIQNVVRAVRIVPNIQLSQLLAFRDETNDRIACVVMIAAENQMNQMIRIVFDQIGQRSIGQVSTVSQVEGFNQRTFLNRSMLNIRTDALFLSRQPTRMNCSQ